MIRSLSFRSLLAAFTVAAAPLVLGPPPSAYAEAVGSVTTGSPAPSFTLPGIDGKQHSLDEYKGKVVVLEWFNEGCPFVKKHYASGNMQALQKEYTGKGVAWLTIVSSAPGKQGHDDAAGHKAKLGEWKASPTAFLTDESGEVGKKYGARTTPHMYVIDSSGALVYQGAIDDKATTKESDIPGSKNFVKAALDEVTAGKPVTTASTEPYGCSVKYG